MQLFKNQVKTYRYTSNKEILVINVRFDDECGNGHNSLGVTGTLYDTTVKGWGKNNDRSVITCGCIHETIQDPRFNVAQEVLDAIPCHLASTDGPMHYVANVMYHASDRDCWKRRKGEPSAFSDIVYVANSPVSYRINSDAVKRTKAVLEAGDQMCYVSKVEHKNTKGETYKFGPKFTILIGEELDPEWYQCPWNTCEEATEWMNACLDGIVRIERIATAWSEGKERNLAAARSIAQAEVPEGHPLYLSDEQLMDEENLKATLEARLPLLKNRLKEVVLALGMKYGDEEE